MNGAEIQVGKFRVADLGQGKFWIEIEDGEALELDRKTLEAWLQKIFEAEF